MYQKELPTALKRTGKTKVYMCGNLKDNDLTKENFEVIHKFNPTTKKQKEDARHLLSKWFPRLNTLSLNGCPSPWQSQHLHSNMGSLLFSFVH
jgi:hypothetical protein